MNKRGQEQIIQESNSIWKKLFIGLIILIVVAGIVFGYFYFKSPTKPASETCSQKGGVICSDNACSGQTTKMVEGWCCIGSCGGQKTPQNTSSNPSPIPAENSSGNLNDTPWSFFAVHEEGPFEGIVEIVGLANQYHVPLTIMFWPSEVAYILKNQSRIDLVHQWQAEGHEIGIHTQDCWDGPECWNGSTDPACGFKYQEGRPVGAPADEADYARLVAPYKIKSGTSSCYKWTPKSYIYEGAGRPDGRNSIAQELYDPELGHTFYALDMKAGYMPGDGLCGGADAKIAEYTTLNPNEIFGFAFHTSDYYGNPADPSFTAHDKSQLIKLFEFLYEKDPQGNKRKTLSDLFESYILPNNLTMKFQNLADSSNATIKACSYVAYENITGYSTTQAFNFGRCLQTGTYCAYDENGLNANNTLYCPTTCIVKNISEFNKSRSLAGSCGNGNCDSGEQKFCPNDCPAGSKS